MHEILGQGAMGHVYRATDRATGDEFAAKVLRPELVGDANLVTRFLQERVILKAVNDPHVVAVRDLVADGDTLAIITELVRGPNLREYASATGTLPPAVAVSLTVQVLEGLAAVHDQIIIHRDVKPENVLVDTSGPEPLARLTDFGIARLASGPVLTRLTGFIGTPNYLAPELAAGGTASPEADIYSAGIMLYELLCGVTPFGGEHTMAVLKAHAERRPGRPPGLPDELWDVLVSMLAKNPEGRPSARQAAGLLTQLRTRLSGIAPLPALTTPPPTLPLEPSGSQDTIDGGRGRLPDFSPAPPELPPGNVRGGRWVLMASLLLALAALGGLATFLLTRHQPRLQTLAAMPTALSIAVGQTRTISLTGTMTDGKPAPAKALGARWTASRPDVASVTDGRVDAVAPGTETVTASVGTLSATISVTVSTAPPPSPVSPSPTSSTPRPPRPTSSISTPGPTTSSSLSPTPTAPPTQTPSPTVPVAVRPLLPTDKVLSGGGGVIYAITSSGDLYWYRQIDYQGGGKGFAPGSGKQVGTGLRGFSQVFSGGGGVIYAIDPQGVMSLARHKDPNGGTPGLDVKTIPSSGWHFRLVFSGGDGIIYAVGATGTANEGKLFWYRFNDPAGFVNTSGSQIGFGWNSYPQVFSDGGGLAGNAGVIYAVDNAGNLFWYRYNDPAGGSSAAGFANGGKRTAIGTGFNSLTVFSGGGGIIYAVDSGGRLFWSHYNDPAGGSPGSLNGRNGLQILP
jgi:serine/threonine-protein kinase